MEESNISSSHNHKKEKLNLGALFLGLVLVMAGLVYFAEVSGLASFPFFGFFYDWPVFVLPLIIIFIGLSMLRASSVLAKILGVVFVFLLVALLSGVFLMGRMGDWGLVDGNNYNYNGFFRMPCFGNTKILEDQGVNNSQTDEYRTGYPMMFRGLRQQ